MCGWWVPRPLCLVAALGALGGLGCGAPPPDAPSPVIRIDPEAVCEGDAFRTVVTVDGARSSPRLTLVPVPPDPSAPPLSFRWRFSGAAHRIVEGSETEPRLQVTTSGDRPLQIELSVEDALGGAATIMQTVAITLPDPATGTCVPGAAP